MSALVADAAKPPEQWGTQFGSGTPDLSQFVKDISQKIEILRHLCAQSEVLRRKDIADRLEQPGSLPWVLRYAAEPLDKA